MCRMEKAGKFGRICKKASFSTDVFSPWHSSRKRGSAIWLNENVRFQQTFSRHDIARASAALFIWLNENVLGKGSFSVKTGVFMKYAAIPYRCKLAAIA